MLATTAWLLLGIVLLAAAALKAADRTGTTVALAAYGDPGRLAAPRWAALVVVEAALAAGIAAGIDGRAPTRPRSCWPASCVVQVVALAQGNDGAPCGCFGARRAALARLGRAHRAAGVRVRGAAAARRRTGAAARR